MLSATTQKTIIKRKPTVIEIITNNDKKPYIPSANLCTDNGAMIAWAGYERFKLGYESSLNFKALPRWPLEKGNFYE